MPLVSIKNELIKARRQHYAVPLLDIFEIQGVEGTMDALIEKRAPTIIGIYSPYAAQPNTRAFAAYIRCRAEDTDVPISLMVDHGSSVEVCIQALSYGFTDVMYDGSQLPLEENIANTKKVVAAAHDLGAAVEAELGHVGSGEEYQTFGGRREGFTDPDAVAYFVRETGVDMLAIAFGNAHGLYKGEPCLDLDLVAEISRRVDVPLVMHGGTGLSDEQFRGAVAAGISKINYATNIINAAGENIRTAITKPGGNLFAALDGVRAAYHEWSGRLYEVFGTAGKV